MKQAIDIADELLPTRITHESGPAFDRERMVEHGDFIAYEFDLPSGVVLARAYLDEIEDVSILGVRLKGEGGGHRIGDEIDERVLAYFRRRFAHVLQLTKDGYVSVE